MAHNVIIINFDVLSLYSKVLFRTLQCYYGIKFYHKWQNLISAVIIIIKNSIQCYGLKVYITSDMHVKISIPI